MSDSILAGLVDKLIWTRVVCMPGAKFCQLESILFDDEFVKQFDLVIFHGGTNEIKSREPEQIVDGFVQLTRRFRRVHPKGWLGFSCLIPRPCDEDFTRDRVIQVNRMIMEWSKVNKVVVLRTFGPFMKEGQTDVSMYKPDWLHPSVYGMYPTGADKLVGFFNHQLSDSVLLPRVKDLVRMVRK